MPLGRFGMGQYITMGQLPLGNQRGPWPLPALKKKKKKSYSTYKNLIDPHSHSFWAPTNIIFGPFQQKKLTQNKIIKIIQQPKS
jgi:hypothetical protein